MTKRSTGRRVIVGVAFGVLAFPVGAVVGQQVLGDASPAQADGTEPARQSLAEPGIESGPTADLTPKPEPMTEAEKDFVARYGTPDNSAEPANPCLPEVPEGHVIRGMDMTEYLKCDSRLHDEPRRSNQIGTDPLPAELVKSCRADIEWDSSCGVWLAKADGKLAPGFYTNDELVDAVAAAGYEWDPER